MGAMHPCCTRPDTLGSLLPIGEAEDEQEVQRFDSLEVEVGREDQTKRPRPDTVIIFDWDDTLLCTSSLRSHSFTRRQLLALAERAQALLAVAMGLGEVIIVTNGIDSWVQDSARQYLPELVPMLAQLRVVSARALHEEAYPDDPIAWKCEAFTQLLKGREGTLLNLVALGDQCPEMQAACHVGELMAPSLVKLVKLMAEPSLGDLLGQLCRLEAELPGLVASGESQGCVLARRRGAPTVEAAGWRCERAERPEQLAGVPPPLPRGSALCCA